MTVVGDPYPEDGTVAGCKKTASNTLEGFVKDGKLELDAFRVLLQLRKHHRPPRSAVPPVL